MLFRNLDADGDWSFGRGKQSYVDKDAAIGLNIKTRLLSWVGDCFFDQKAGIDWVNRLGSKNQRALLELDLRRLILQSQDVTGLVSFDTVLVRRAFDASYSVNTVYSQAYIDSLTVEIQMPDIIDAEGLQVLTENEIIVNLQTGMRAIYGPDINVDQNSPDGQMIGIIAQMGTDIRELLVQVNNGMDPDQAMGVIQDQRVVYNNITRAGGTFTIQPIRLVLDRTLTLQGLDADFDSINGTGYTVQDDAGTKFILVDSETFTAGTYDRNFRAQKIGQVEVVPNTITNQVTIVLGVTSVNNPSGALQIGQNEETDPQLRVRRQQSVALSTTGYLNGLLGSVLNLPGVTDARLFENVTDATDVNGIPEHGIWLIVEGGANSDIADEIYNRKSYGANMKGSVNIVIDTPSGDFFTAKFDRPLAEDLYIQFDIQKTDPTFVFDEAGIKQSLVDALSYGIGQAAETSSLTVAAIAAIIANGGGGVPVNMEVSDDGATWVDYLETTTLQHQFTVDVGRIGITIVT